MPNCNDLHPGQTDPADDRIIEALVKDIERRGPVFQALISQLRSCAMDSNLTPRAKRRREQFLNHIGV